ncbi:NUDIX domain-containing protein [Microbacterium sp. NPDC058345]|uniref:NUDIX domain-containing protein n=1 Tax=Microbacterium sp. NPDC058345 TaxID=3346455 RepID=UPI003659102F
MTIIPPSPGEPRRPQGPRDSGDAWVVAPTGEKYWGRYGAAGLLAVDSQRGVLLQHRVGWSHFGGTWGLPGGALHEGELALDGALREAQEEAGIPDGAVRARFSSVLDLGIWSYTTVVADVVRPFEPVISDPESLALEWVAVDEVGERPLHPGFAAAWPMLRDLLGVRPAIVVDAANVVGSVPDGWWKDRAGAAGRLGRRLSAWASGGVAAARLGLDADRWYPPVSMVVEGEARAVPDAAHLGDRSEAQADSGSDAAARRGAIDLVRATGHGDDAIVAAAERLIANGRAVTVVTSDRELRERVQHAGANAESAGWLLGQLD